MKALIMLAHGARDAGWAAPFEQVAAQLRLLQPQLDVRLAFLEFMKPSLPEAVTMLAATGCTHVDVLPMFLGTGGHVRRDLPRLLDAARETHPDLTIQLHAAIGEMHAVHRAMAATIDSHLRGAAR